MAESGSVAIERQPTTFFSVVTDVQSYINILYHLLAFPLGIFYFVFLVTGIAVGVGLIVVWVGIPILLLVMAGWWAMAAFERVMTARLLNVSIAPMSREEPPEPGIWARVKSLVRNPVTWKGLAYLLVKFPYGILAFVLVTVALSLSVALLAAPIIYPYAQYTVGVWQIDTMGEALTLSAIGVGIALVSLHLMNGLAALWARFAQLMLGSGQAEEAFEFARPGLTISRQAQNLIGVALVGFGVFLVAREIGLALFSFNMGQLLAPLVLILIGMWFVVGRGAAIVKSDAPPTPKKE